MKEHEESARRIREAILESGLNQQEVADKAKISKQSVSQYLNGVHIPGNQKAGALGEVLGVRPQWLMCLDDVKYETEDVDNSEILEMIKKLSEDKQKMILKIIETMIEE